MAPPGAGPSRILGAVGIVIVFLLASGAAAGIDPLGAPPPAPPSATLVVGFTPTSGWDSSGWDSSGWDSSGWDSSGWDSSGWDSSGWDATTGNHSMFDNSWLTLAGAPTLKGVDPLLHRQWGLRAVNASPSTLHS